eukprot:gene2273-2576_t
MEACLKSGANGVQIDFDDGFSPTWRNCLDAQANIIRAAEAGSTCQDDSLLIVRPRAINLDEMHLLIDGEPMAGALFDYGLFMFHSAQKLVAQGRGPFLYLAKMETAAEARWWNGVIAFAEHALDIQHGTSRVIIIVENIWAAFAMEEMLYYLKDYAVALNTGRWDYIFSCVKHFAASPRHIYPERSYLTNDQPFLSAYYRLLQATLIKYYQMLHRMQSTHPSNMKHH